MDVQSKSQSLAMVLGCTPAAASEGAFDSRERRWDLCLDFSPATTAGEVACFTRRVRWVRFLRGAPNSGLQRVRML